LHFLFTGLELFNSSSVFSLIAISSSSSEILSSVFFYSAGMAFHSVLYFCYILFCEVIHIIGYFLFNIVNFDLNSFISLFVVVSVSVWCLFMTSMISFICFCVFSYSLFLTSLNFFSASYTFWLTMSSYISMKFSLITCRISSFRGFLWASLGSLA
jgi:hypothetical protein